MTNQSGVLPSISVPPPLAAAAVPRLPGLRPAAGLVAGLAGGVVYGALLAGQPALAMTSGMSGLPAARAGLGAHLLLSAAAGVGFGVLCGRLVATPGAALMWGASFGLLWWLVVALTLAPLLAGRAPDWTIEAMAAAFPLLAGLLVSYGAVLGLAYVAVTALVAGAWRPGRRGQIAAAFLESVTIGGLAGLAGGLAFGVWMERAGFFPLVAGLVRSDSADVGRALHFAISVAIGASYGVLFRPDIRGIGSSVAWGMAYGLIWWVLGPLTLLPWLLGQGVHWSLAAGRDAFPSLVGHVIYGLVLGVVYAVVARGWRLLFVESDPLNREPEGPGTRSLRALGTGFLASVAGGLVFTAVMVETGVLPQVAGLVGGASPKTGFAVHMTISAIVGATYGLLFRREADGPGSALAWGLVYGLVLGVVYAVVARGWRLLFVESDPLNREPEGPGTRSLRALGTGFLASVAGGLVFTAVMVETGVLPQVAGLVGGASPAAGFAVHMTISAIVGATYGLLFRREADGPGSALAWGLVYGLAWWILGPLTLLPALLGAGLQWSLGAALAAYPSLIGHLAYGGVTALAYQFLARRHDPTMRPAPRRGVKRAPARPPARPAGTPAPALWALVLVAGVLLPLILSTGVPGASGVYGVYGGAP